MNLQEQKIDLLARMHNDLLVSAKVLFPDIFYAPFDPIHYGIRDVLQATSNQKRALAAPRGIGKTSLANLVQPTVGALLQGKRYIVPVSATSELAIQQSENLKFQLTNNPNIVKLFGELKTSIWSKDMWVIRTPDGQETCIFPRGAGQQIRGQNWRGFRPDLIIIDDLEKPDEVRNDRIRGETWSWFNADLLKSPDVRKRSWEILFIGTILHHDSCLQKILESPDWLTARFEICDDNFKSNAPHMYTDEQLREMYESHRRDGIADVFFREMRNLPAAQGDDAAFRVEHFRYYEEEEEALSTRKGLETLLVIDPAKATTMASAESAVVVVSLDLRNHKIFVRDVISDRFHPEEFYNAVNETVAFYRPDLIAIEVTGLHEFVLHPLKNSLLRAGNVIEVMELTARGGVGEPGKVARIRSLVPYYRQGLIFHNKRTCTKLESQLLQFPNSRRWDVMDAFGYIPEVLERGARYLSWHADYENQTEDPRELIEREFADLEEDYFEDEFSDGSWRIWR